MISQPPSILVVDDEPDIADSIAEFLELHGFKVSVAYNAPAALEAVESRPPDVVLTDIGMPGFDGWTLCSLLREREETRRSLLVAITAYGQEKDRNQSAVAGFDLHLVKPVHPNSLLQLLRQWLPVVPLLR